MNESLGFRDFRVRNRDHHVFDESGPRLLHGSNRCISYINWFFSILFRRRILTGPWGGLLFGLGIGIEFGSLMRRYYVK